MAPWSGIDALSRLDIVLAALFRDLLHRVEHICDFLVKAIHLYVYSIFLQT